MPLSLLWIVPKSPVPPTDGARVASRSLLTGILDEGCRVHLVVVPQSDEMEPGDMLALKQQLPVDRVTILPRRWASRRPAQLASLGLSWMRRPNLPLTVSPFARRDLSRALTTLRRECDVDLVVYDGLHVAAHLFGQDGSVQELGPYLLRAHNREAELWRQKAARCQTRLLRWLFTKQAAAMARFEDAIAIAAKGVATVSDNDRSHFLEEIPGLTSERVATIPIGCEFGPPLPFPEADPWQLLFVGRLDWPPNREGLRWFLDHVWPTVIRTMPQWRLTVAGSGEYGWLAPYRRLPRIEMHGFAKDLDVLYSRSSLAILPLFIGSGIRVKAIEAGRFGRACLSTAVGVEGLGLDSGRDFFCADTQQEWLRTLAAVTPTELRRRGSNAWASLHLAFDLRGVARSFLAFASDLAARQGLPRKSHP